VVLRWPGHHARHRGGRGGEMPRYQAFDLFISARKRRAIIEGSQAARGDKIGFVDRGRVGFPKDLKGMFETLGELMEL